jgi:tRNA A58 N-methylase Trm61
MLHAAKTGSTGFEKAHDMGVFDYLEENPEEVERFGNTMIEFHGPVAGAVAAAYDFSGLQKIVDVGGGHGNLLAEILKGNPQLEGILFELPHVAEAASEHLRAAGLADRCEVVGGDFVDSIPEGGDAYVLSHIVHDWDEPRCRTLLENCRRAMSQGARLLILQPHFMK